MSRRFLGGGLVAVLLATVMVAATSSSVAAEDMTFSNPQAITVPDDGPANPYPSSIAVSGMSGSVTDVSVEIPDIVHNWSRDFDILLVSPTNRGVLLLSDAGSSPISGSIRFADGSPSPIEDGQIVLPGTFAPTNYGTEVDVFPNGPSPVMGQAMSHFDGEDPNGSWQLWVVDDLQSDVNGSMSQGWRITITAEEDPCAGVPEDGFTDVAVSNVHESNIDCLVHFGVTVGKTTTTYDPQGQVTRGQMASFVARAIEAVGTVLPANPPDAFDDDNGNTHELRINQLAAAGVIGGNGESGRSYRPQTGMRRDHMASFMFEADVFAFNDPLDPGPDAFTDDDGNPHEVEINALANEGVIAGRGGGIFDPTGTVTRAQMASFLARLLQLWAEFGNPPTPPN